MESHSQSGFVKVKGHSIYYEVHGNLNSGKIPMLMLHGGPGSAHNYLSPLAAMSSVCPIVFYDQLGCGRSQVPVTDKYYTAEYFAEELETVRRRLKLSRIHLYGHSWGGMLALEYMRKPRDGIESVILASSIINSKLYAKQAQALLRKINKNYPRIAARHEKAGTTGSDEYEKIYKQYNERHLFRLKNRPAETKGKSDSFQYVKMWGPSEMQVLGNLKRWSGLKVLPTITQPTLVISGEHDEVTPEHNELAAKLVPNAESVIIAGGSHLAHIEKTGLYLRALKDFLSSVN